jgi:hypothetical protein
MTGCEESCYRMTEFGAAMAIVLEGITRLADKGLFRLDVSIDGQPATFRAGVDATGGGFETEFFFLLSNRGLAETGSSTQYHMDLGLLLRDFDRGIAVRLPFVFGYHRRFLSPDTATHRWWKFWRRGRQRRIA